MPPQAKAVQVQATVTEPELWEEYMKFEGLLVVDVYCAWCGPCAAMERTFKNLSTDIPNEGIKYLRADCDKLVALDKYRGKSEPTFLFYKNGRLFKVVKGAKAAEIVRLVTKYQPLGPGLDVDPPDPKEVEREEKARREAEREKQLAAVKLQSTFRGYRVRRGPAGGEEGEEGEASGTAEGGATSEDPNAAAAPADGSASSSAAPAAPAAAAPAPALPASASKDNIDAGAPPAGGTTSPRPPAGPGSGRGSRPTSAAGARPGSAAQGGRPNSGGQGGRDVVSPRGTRPGAPAGAKGRPPSGGAPAPAPAGKAAPKRPPSGPTAKGPAAAPGRPPSGGTAKAAPAPARPPSGTKGAAAPARPPSGNAKGAPAPAPAAAAPAPAPARPPSGTAKGAPAPAAPAPAPAAAAPAAPAPAPAPAAAAPAAPAAPAPAPAAPASTTPRTTGDARRDGARERLQAGKVVMGLAANDNDGVLKIATVREGKAAAAAGLKVGDVIKAVGNFGVATTDEFTAALNAGFPGATETIEIVRDGTPSVVTFMFGASDLTMEELKTMRDEAGAEWCDAQKAIPSRPNTAGSYGTGSMGSAPPSARSGGS